MAQLVASTSGVVLGGVVEVVGSNLARGKIFTASIGSVDLQYPSVYIYICSAQSRNRYHSRMALRKVRVPTWLRKVGILTLRRAILEWSLRKVRIWTK